MTAHRPFFGLFAKNEQFPINEIYNRSIRVKVLDISSKPAGNANRHYVLFFTGTPAEPTVDLVKSSDKIRTDPIQLVDKADPRNSVPIGLPPDRFTLRLNTLNGTENDNGPIENSQRPFNFSGKIHVPRRVNDIDNRISPVRRHTSRVNRNSAFRLFRVKVGRGRTFIDTTSTMNRPGEKQNSFGRRRLTGVNVGNDANIPKPFQRGAHDELLW
jgi:hypothetical protein